MITRRYPDKVLFLPISICPVYCSYCTRSRLIGGSTESIKKNTYGANQNNWENVFTYLRNNPEIEDVVISGGDAYMLNPRQIKYIGESLLEIHSIRRIRFATKGIAIFPQKILSDDSWFKAVAKVVKMARKIGKSAVIHTHFSYSGEITEWSKKAMERIYNEGILVRNQAVLQAGVNDSPEEMINLNRKLSYINIQPYYVYQHDLVPGCEHFRTTLREAIELEKIIRGTTAGFNTPTFVCDLPKGGGKRHVASYEYYDEKSGISVWKAPGVKPGKKFIYFDPLHKLTKEYQKKWEDSKIRQEMINNALAKVE
jgi:lysine 2,3-aminomutase